MQTKLRCASQNEIMTGIPRITLNQRLWFSLSLIWLAMLGLGKPERLASRGESAAVDHLHEVMDVLQI